MMVGARSSARPASGPPGLRSGWSFPVGASTDHNPISGVSAVIEWLRYLQAISDVMGGLGYEMSLVKSEGGVLDSMNK